MLDFFGRLFDTSGFTPRRECGNWTPEMIWLHVGSDLFIWLAYLSIPLVLIYFMRKRPNVPFPWLFGLFAAFILACGFTHFLDALMFHQPMYRLGGLVKLVTAVVSWATVFALVTATPRVMEAFAAMPPPADDTALHRPVSGRRDGRQLDYIVAILAAVLAILLRGLLDDLLKSDHVFVVSLLAVVAVSWQYGFGPGLVTLFVSMVGFIFFFVAQPRYTFTVVKFGDQLAVGLFFFCGAACCVLGEAQRYSQRKAKQALAGALEKQSEQEVEVNRRRVVEYNLRQREEELLEANRNLAAAESDTRASEARFRTLIAAVPQIVWVARPDGSREYSNAKWYEFTGLTEAESAGWGWADALHPDDRAESEATWRRAVETGEEFEIARRYRGADGEYRWFLGRARPQRDERGEIVRWFGTSTDVHDSRVAAEAVRRSEERFRTLTEAVPHLVWNSDAGGAATYFNTRWVEYTGLDTAAAAGEGWLAAVHPDDRDRVAAAWRETVTRPTDGTANRFSHELRLRHGETGGYRWFLTVATPFRRPDGSVDQWIVSMADIHDQRTAAERVAVAAERFRTLTEAVPQIVWTADPRGTVTSFNRRWAQYTGLTLDRGDVTDWGRVIHPDDATRVDTNWKLATTQGVDFYTQEFRLRRAEDGEFRWMLSSAVPLRTPAGEVAEWVGSITDIDDQKQAAKNLERTVRDRTAQLELTNLQLTEEVVERTRAEELVTATARELKRSNEELEQFAYIASHDLQEPLRKIQSFGDLLKTKCRDQLPASGKEYTDKMLNSAGRMRRLIDDLLSLSRVTSQGKPYTRVDLTELVNQVKADLDLRIDQIGATVDVGSLPAIDADPSQMRQLFQNLIMNALKFHKPGVAPAVLVRGEVLPGDAGKCRLTVEDNGIGFEEKYRDRIFQVFQRLHGRDEYEGTGVGLAICQKIVERHGGTIAAQGRLGEGATFVITLPVRQPTTETPENA